MVNEKLIKEEPFLKLIKESQWIFALFSICYVLFINYVVESI